VLPAVIDRLSRRFPRMVFSVKQPPRSHRSNVDLRERRIDLIFGE